ncbi:c-type cytochrome [Leptospira ellisii]|uniref:c-type cytochrome n=1 Tax=Leptospira ellisii TaxID=2023197 RepID=UPI000C2B192C|nr:cytochrome c [Leptospira ellisii]PKA05738.1 cytochrome C [Leptospira ellisii]
MEGSKLRGGIFRLLFIGFVLVFANCKEDESLTPEQKLVSQGKGLYVTNCSACHNQNPAIDGAEDTYDEKLIFHFDKASSRIGTYPPGYVPKRQSQIMTRLPLNDDQIKSIEAFLNAP